MASVLTTESVKDMNLKVGKKVMLVIKAIHVLPVKEWNTATLTGQITCLPHRTDYRIDNSASAVLLEMRFTTFILDLDRLICRCSVVRGPSRA